MSKLYFNKTDIPKHEGLNESLMYLVELGIPELEKQRVFRSLYDIEIMGVTVYYRKNWRYDRQPQKANAIR